MQDLAKEFRVSSSRINNIVREIRIKPETIREKIAQEAERALTDESLAVFIDEKLRNGEMI